MNKKLFFALTIISAIVLASIASYDNGHSFDNKLTLKGWVGLSDQEKSIYVASYIEKNGIEINVNSSRVTSFLKSLYNECKEECSNNEMTEILSSLEPALVLKNN